ncbi:META domain-containing protein [Coralliovum pocilloporae]|uniref:META domain-containing protein n=1 Tax=Coralliovum pocilloporae TaxID=3066369 RepID=UPI003307AA09
MIGRMLMVFRTAFARFARLLVALLALSTGVQSIDQAVAQDKATDRNSGSVVLSGTHWIFQAIDLGEVWWGPARGTEVFLRFSDKRVTGSSGCNRFFGEYTQSGKELALSELGKTRIACDPEIMKQESAFLDLLSGVTEVTFDGQLATFSNPDKGHLVLRRKIIGEPKTQHQSDSRYDRCKQAGGALVGAQNSQCVSHGEVAFSDGRTPISLDQCTGYFDGCNTCQVENGVLKGCTRKACSAEHSAPLCLVGDETLLDGVGRIVERRGRSIEIVFDDIVERFTLKKGLKTTGLEKGDEVFIRYLTSAARQRPKIIEIRRWKMPENGTEQ